MSAILVESLLPSIVHGIKLLLHRSLLDSHHKSLDLFDTIASAILFMLILDSRYKGYNSFNNPEMELQEGRLYEQDINKVIKEFTAGILQAAKECIPKGARKEYKPYWSDKLENTHKVRFKENSRN